MAANADDPAGAHKDEVNRLLRSLDEELAEVLDARLDDKADYAQERARQQQLYFQQLVGGRGFFILFWILCGVVLLIWVESIPDPFMTEHGQKFRLGSLDLNFQQKSRISGDVRAHMHPSSPACAGACHYHGIVSLSHASSYALPIILYVITSSFSGQHPGDGAGEQPAAL